MALSPPHSLFSLPKLAKTHGVQIKASGAMLRLRLYRALGLLPPDAYEGNILVEEKNIKKTFFSNLITKVKFYVLGHGFLIQIKEASKIVA